MPDEFTVPIERVNAAIDMNICMVTEELSEVLNVPIEKMLYRFLQSKTCSLLYKPELRFWWDGPSYIADMYLQEIGKNS